MCCVLTVVLFLGPRLGIVFWWLFNPSRWNLVFDSLILPVLGFLFLPWTTLMYVLVGANGVAGFDWFLLILALLGDLGAYGGGGYGNRRRIRRYRS